MSRGREVSWRPGRVQERLIAALIPPSRDDHGTIAAAPLPTLPTLSKLADIAAPDLMVSTTRMDRSGRIHERLLLRELRWEPGRHLEIDTLHGMILIAAEPRGRHIVDPRGAISLPAPLRRLCGIEFGPPLILTAAVPEQVMVVHPSATVAHLLAAHYTELIGTTPTSETHTLPPERSSP